MSPAEGAAALQILNVVYQLATLTLTALGLAIVFGLLGVMNMAHGEFVMLGAYAVVVAQKMGWPLVASVPMAIVVCGLIGWTVERWLVRPLYARPFDTLLATWGLSIFLRKLAEVVFGKGYQNVEADSAAPVAFWGLQYPGYRLFLIVFTVLLMVGVVLWYRRSHAGLQLRAMTANPVLARALGIDTGALATRAFVVGVVLAGLAGVMLAPVIRIEPGMGVDYLLNAFFVQVVGGLGSLAGLTSGIGLVGGTQAGISGVIDQTAGYASVLVLSILFLWLRPQGLYGRR